MKRIISLLMVLLITAVMSVPCTYAASLNIPPSDLSAVQKPDGIYLYWTNNSKPSYLVATLDNLDRNYIVDSGHLDLFVGIHNFGTDLVGPDGSTVKLYVTAYFADNSKAVSQPVLLTIDKNKFKPVNSPFALSAKAEGNGDVTLNWDYASYNETGFEISEEDSNGDGGVINVNTPGIKTYTVTTPHKTGMTYKYRVRAVNALGTSNYSNEVSVTILVITATSIPSNCSAALLDNGDIKITWQDNSDWETGFTIIRTDSTGNESVFDTRSPNLTSYIDNSKHKEGETYLYEVAAHDNNGQSGYSNQAGVTIPVSKTPDTPKIQVPSAPSGLKAVQDNDKIILNWKDNSDNETGFLLVRTDDKGSAPISSNLPKNTGTYNDSKGITAGTTYTYELKSVNSSGTSATVNLSISANNYNKDADLRLDGTQSSWADSEIRQAYRNGLTYSGVMGNFKKNITREEFCTIVVKMYEKISGKKAIAGSNPFKDTKNSDIIKAYTLGIVKGSGTTFAPSKTITRQEMCVMITRCLSVSVPGFNIKTNTKFPFKDQNLIAGWAKDAMKFCYSAGIMTGSSGKIAPLSNTTREQAIAIIERTYQKYK